MDQKNSLDFHGSGLWAVILGGSSGFGHFVALLGRTADGLVVGDPLQGREVIPVAEFRRRYTPTGFSLVIRR